MMEIIFKQWEEEKNNLNWIHGLVVDGSDVILLYDFML